MNAVTAYQAFELPFSWFQPDPDDPDEMPGDIALSVYRHLARAPMPTLYKYEHDGSWHSLYADFGVRPRMPGHEQMAREMAVQAVSKRDKESLMQLHLDGRKEWAIAKEFQCSYDAMRQRISRAEKKMRQVFDMHMSQSGARRTIIGIRDVRLRDSELPRWQSVECRIGMTDDARWKLLAMHREQCSVLNGVRTTDEVKPLGIPRVPEEEVSDAVVDRSTTRRAA